MVWFDFTASSTDYWVHSINIYFYFRSTDWAKKWRLFHNFTLVKYDSEAHLIVSSKFISIGTVIGKSPKPNVQLDRFLSVEWTKTKDQSDSEGEKSQISFWFWTIFVVEIHIQFNLNIASKLIIVQSSSQSQRRCSTMSSDCSTFSVSCQSFSPLLRKMYPINFLRRYHRPWQRCDCWNLRDLKRK